MNTTNTKYRYKPLEIEAIQFEASPQGIASIALFGGTDFGGVNLRGNPLPAAFVDGLCIPEGSWLLRNESGMYKVLKDSVFRAVCEQRPAVQAAPARQAVDKQEPQGPQTITRDEATSLGLVRYFSGAACPKGHTAERYTLNNRCVVCSKESVQAHAQRQKRKVTQREASARSYAKRKAAMGVASLAQNMGA